MRDLIVRPFSPEDVSAAAEHLAARHQRQREMFPILPAKFEEPEASVALVRSMLSFADGFAAEGSGGHLAGFMFAIQNMPSPTSGSARFAPVRGSMMFAHGHAVAPGVAPFPVYNALFGALAERYLSDGIFDHFAHVPAGDRELDEAWSNLGFGRSTAVAARTTAPLAAASRPADIRIATLDDLDEVYRLAAEGNAFHSQPPMFTPYVEPQTEAAVRGAFRKALADETQALFLGYVEGRAAGLLWVEPPKGSPLFTPDNACYIGDTAVSAEARGSGMGTALLDRALSWARERGFEHVTLHFHASNPLSSAFWQGHGFLPVMYHLRRRIDERVAWARPRG